MPDVKSKRNTLKTELRSKPQNANKTMDFSIIIQIFPYFYTVPNRIQADLDDLRNYRNGLFHFEAPDRKIFELLKQEFRLIEWILKHLEKKIGWWLGDEFNTIDPMGRKRALLKQLKLSIRSENAFNLQRKIFQYNKKIELIFQSYSRLNGDIYIPDALIWQQPCPACSYQVMHVFESGNMRDGKWVERFVFAQCNRCDFSFSDREFDAMKIKGQPSLRAVFRQLQKQKNANLNPANKNRSS